MCLLQPVETYTPFLRNIFIWGHELDLLVSVGCTKNLACPCFGGMYPLVAKVSGVEAHLLQLHILSDISAPLTIFRFWLYSIRPRFGFQDYCPCLDLGGKNTGFKINTKSACITITYFGILLHTLKTLPSILPVITSHGCPSVGITTPFRQKRKLSPEVKWSRDMAIAI